MPETTVTIGGRSFEVACLDGEEQYLHAAAKMLDDEAQILSDQVGRVPEARMLLMAGLMLADKTSSLNERLRQQEKELEVLRNQPAPIPERIEVEVPVEVPVIPSDLIEVFAQFADHAEALADSVEEKATAQTDDIQTDEVLDDVMV